MNMGTPTSNSIPFHHDATPHDAADEQETTPGGNEPIRWVTIYKTLGLVPAQIMAGRLEAEGIPARAWQEGAGQALGLTVGLLGNGHVSVPDTYADEARQLLDEIEKENEAWAEEGWDEEE